VEFTVARSDTHSEDPVSGLTADQSVQSFLQAYRLDFSRSLFPNLVFAIGGGYGVVDTSTDVLGDTFEGSRKLFTPYVRLKLHTPWYGAELAYERRQEKFDAGLATTGLNQETWRADFSWVPYELPETHLNFARRNTYDLGRAGLDVVQDRVHFRPGISPSTPSISTTEGRCKKTATSSTTAR
jgi:hypothetical protein